MNNQQPHEITKREASLLTQENRVVKSYIDTADKVFYAVIFHKSTEQYVGIIHPGGTDEYYYVRNLDQYNNGTHRHYSSRLNYYLKLNNQPQNTEDGRVSNANLDHA